MVEEDRGVEELDEKLYGFNPDHRPSKRLENMKLAPDVYIIWRGKIPDMRKVRGIIQPGKMVWLPNCAVVLRAGSDCKLAEKGDYVFWDSFGTIDPETGMVQGDTKAQPVIFDFTIEDPSIFTLRERHVHFAVPPMVPNEELSEELETVKPAGVIVQ